MAPARAGVILFAKDVSRIAGFYEALWSLERTHARADLVVLTAPDFQLVVHGMPPEIAANVVITSPPRHREETAIKMFFTVPSVAKARETASRLGGEIFTESWEGMGFKAYDAVDPEGNVFHVRESIG